MFAQIVYIHGHTASTNSAKLAEQSCKNYGIIPHMVEGVTPETLDEIHEKFKLDPVIYSRAWDYETQGQKYLRTKKSCFYNNVLFWQKVIARNEIGIFLEHDALMVAPWDNPEFDEVLCLNLYTAVKSHDQINMKAGWSYKYTGNMPRILRDLDYGLKYHKENLFKGGSLIPGTAAYAITPKGAQRLLKSIQINGWDQSDYFINTKNVNIQYADPEYFQFNSINLRTSAGIKK
jgi:GR25 family glycosyltransferase involved in LPS biosynthesis